VPLLTPVAAYDASVALLERDEMLDALDGHLAAALQGEGRLVLVTGEAGVGKSALAQAFAARHEPGVRVLRGACDALFTPVLSISPRTVDRHVSAVLQKLGVSSRREAARVPIGTPPTAANTVPR
jgi:ATP/maltotriose-dependent transcriptional regulator MalT